jgi:Carboxypeptidase regulatory-like domain/TonB dependent receptor-like, beta-barrel
MKRIQLYARKASSRLGITRAHQLRTRLGITIALLVLPFVPGLIAAQTVTGSITGTVIDPSKAAVAGASVTIQNSDTKDIRRTLSNAAGVYAVPALPPGTYTVTAAAPGFASTTSSVRLLLNANLKVDLPMKIGASSQVVQVAEPGNAALETQSHDLSDVIDAQAIEDMPSSNGLLFQALTNNLTVENYGTGTYGSGNDSNINQYQGSNNSLEIGGTNIETTVYLEDGVRNVNYYTQTATVMPPIEASQEVNIIRGNADARYDEPTVLNVITKNGTNAFHGRVYDYLQNNALDAIGEINTPLSVTRYNQFGADVGGPSLFSKRLFFFYGYQGLRNYQTSTQQGFFPTAAERSGDFSADSAVIYNPTTYNSANPSQPLTPFPGNKIPAGKLDAFATAYLKLLVPLPNGLATIKGNNYLAVPRKHTFDDQNITRVDFNINQNDHLYGAWETYSPLNTGPSTFSMVTDIFTQTNKQDGKASYIEESHAFNSSLLNIARIGYNRENIQSRSESGLGKENYFQALGLTGLNPPSQEWLPPTVSITTYTTVGGKPNTAIQNTYEYSDEVDWTHGMHTMYVGFDLDRVQFNANWWPSQSPTGSFSYNGQYTSLNAWEQPNFQLKNYTPSATNALADFMLGYPSSINAAAGAPVSQFRQWNIMPYFQDDWRVTRKLTLNLGLRYDDYTAPNDRLGHAGVYNIATNQYKVGAYNTTADWDPRVGFAYQIDGNTSIHGGYGIYDSLYSYYSLTYMMNDPNYITSLSAAQTATHPVNQLFNIASASAVFAVMPKPNGVFGQGNSSNTSAPKMPTTYSQEWNLAIQRSFGRHWLATIDYVGNRGAHQFLLRNANQATLPSPTDPNPTSIADINSRRPYPSFTENLSQFEKTGSSHYGALEGELRKDFGNGFSFDTNFLWQKSMSVMDSDKDFLENGLDPQLDYGLSDFSQKYRYKASGIYELPFGKGKPFLNGGKIWENELGGWRASGVLIVGAGFPFFIRANDVSETGGTGQNVTSRANQSCNGNNFAGRSLNQWFDKSCFTQPNNGTYGNEQRNNLTGPRNTNVDMSMFKSFPIHEKQAVEFRTDFFSALNHPLPYAPNNQMTGTGYGAITHFQGARVIQGSLKIVF